MDLLGKNLIGAKLSSKGQSTFSGIDPTTSQALNPQFVEATEEEVNEALDLAEKAFERFREEKAQNRALFLEAIAEEIIALGEELIKRAQAETALPQARLEGERGRTVAQLNMFAELVREGSWVEASIDRAIPHRKPLPKPDLRRKLGPIGPVVVFSASNFPLAFSVAGGDTASALAAGNPVIVKAHPAHPGASELVAHVIAAAVERLALPPGTFALLFDDGIAVGQALVRHPAIRAVGFTGSHKAGRAIMDASSARREPIP